MSAGDVTRAAIKAALADHMGAGREVAITTQAVTAHHVPGFPIATKEDIESTEAYLAEVEATTVDTSPPEPVELPEPPRDPNVPIEYFGVDTRSAEGAYRTRSNIVRPD